MPPAAPVEVVCGSEPAVPPSGVTPAGTPAVTALASTVDVPPRTAETTESVALLRSQGVDLASAIRLAGEHAHEDCARVARRLAEVRLKRELSNPAGLARKIFREGGSAPAEKTVVALAAPTESDWHRQDRLHREALARERAEHGEAPPLSALLGRAPGGVR